MQESRIEGIGFKYLPKSVKPLHPIFRSRKVISKINNDLFYLVNLEHVNNVKGG